MKASPYQMKVSIKSYGMEMYSGVAVLEQRSEQELKAFPPARSGVRREQAGSAKCKSGKSCGTNLGGDI